MRQAAAVSLTVTRYLADPVVSFALFPVTTNLGTSYEQVLPWDKCFRTLWATRTYTAHEDRRTSILFAANVSLTQVKAALNLTAEERALYTGVETVHNVAVVTRHKEPHFLGRWNPHRGEKYIRSLFGEAAFEHLDYLPDTVGGYRLLAVHLRHARGNLLGYVARKLRYYVREMNEAVKLPPSNE